MQDGSTGPGSSIAEARALAFVDVYCPRCYRTQGLRPMARVQDGVGLHLEVLRRDDLAPGAQLCHCERCGGQYQVRALPASLHVLEEALGIVRRELDDARAMISTLSRAAA